MNEAIQSRLIAKDGVSLSERLEKWSPEVLSLVRIVVALLYLQSGLGKFFGFPSAGPPLAGLLILAAIIETFGSLLLLIGLFTRAAAFIMSGEMAFAYFMAHAPKSFYPAVNGGSLAVLYCFVFLYFVFAGGGAWSVDRLLFRARAGLEHFGAIACRSAACG